MLVKNGRQLLTSVSRRGVPGTDPYAELLRVLGGVRMRRPYLSNLAGDAVRETRELEPADPEEPVRWWFRGCGRDCVWSADLLDSGGGDVEMSVLLALTRAMAF